MIVEVVANFCRVYFQLLSRHDNTHQEVKNFKVNSFSREINRIEHGESSKLPH